MKGTLILLLLLCSFLACANDTIQARKLIEKADFFYNRGTPEGDSLALLYYSQSIHIYQKHRINNSLLAKAYLFSANIYGFQQQHRNAIVEYKNAIKLNKFLTRYSLIDTHRRLGEALYFDYQYDSALVALKIADNLSLKTPNYSDYIKIINTLGLIYHTRGHYEEAISYFRKAIHLTNDPATLVTFYANIGDAFRRQKKYNQANQALQQALHYARSHPMEGVILNNIGRVYLEKKEYQAAIQYFERAKAVAAKVKDDNILFEVNLYNNFGAAYLGVKDYKAAHSSYNQAIKSAGEGKSVPKSRSYVGRAQVFEATNELNKALGAYNEALKILNLNGRTISELYQLTALTAKAKLLRRMKNFKGAFDCYIPAVSLAWYIYRTYESEEMKSFFKETAAPIYREAVEATFALYAETEDDEYKEAVFALMEQHRNTILAENLRLNEYKPAALPQELLQKEQALKERITRLNYRMTESKSGNVEKLQDELREVETELSSLATELERDAAYHRYKYDTTRITSGEVRAELFDGMAMIEYFKGDEHWYAAVLTADAYELRRFDVSQPQLVFMKNLFYEQKQAASHKGDTALYQLYREMFEPLVPLLDGNTRLAVIPDGELSFFPFDLLISDLNKSRYLVYDYTVSHHQSAQLFMRGKRHKVGQQHKVLAMAPFASGSTKQFSRLVGSKKELNSIDLPKVILYDRDATKDALKRLAGDFNVLHLATHGKGDGGEPFLAFYGGERYYTFEIYNLNLHHTDMVALSACETGRGRFVEGEGIMSIARACMQAGTASVVTTFWVASQTSTFQIFDKFYEYLLKGYAKDEALRQAKLDFIANPQNDVDFIVSPYHWANFAVVGDIKPLYPGEKEEKPGYLPMIGLVAGLLVLLAGAAWWGWKKVSRR